LEFTEKKVPNIRQEQVAVVRPSYTFADYGMLCRRNRAITFLFPLRGRVMTKSFYLKIGMEKQITSRLAPNSHNSARHSMETFHYERSISVFAEKRQSEAKGENIPIFENITHICNLRKGICT